MDVREAGLPHQVAMAQLVGARKAPTWAVARLRRGTEPTPEPIPREGRGRVAVASGKPKSPTLAARAGPRRPLARLVPQGKTGCEVPTLPPAIQDVALADRPRRRIVLADRPTKQGGAALMLGTAVPPHEDGGPPKRRQVARLVRVQVPTPRAAGQDVPLTHQTPRRRLLPHTPTMEGGRPTPIGATIPPQEDGHTPIGPEVPWPIRVQIPTTGLVVQDGALAHRTARLPLLAHRPSLDGGRPWIGSATIPP